MDGLRKNIGKNIDLNTAIIVISGNQHDMGRIISANYELFELLGYDSKQILGLSINKIMTKVVADSHNTCIEKFFMNTN